MKRDHNCVGEEQIPHIHTGLFFDNQDKKNLRFRAAGDSEMLL